MWPDDAAIHEMLNEAMGAIVHALEQHRATSADAEEIAHRAYHEHLAHDVARVQRFAHFYTQADFAQCVRAFARAALRAAALHCDAVCHWFTRLSEQNPEPARLLVACYAGRLAVPELVRVFGGTHHDVRMRIHQAWQALCAIINAECEADGECGFPRPTQLLDPQHQL
jgi:hypothetical protein